MTDTAPADDPVPGSPSGDEPVPGSPSATGAPEPEPRGAPVARFLRWFLGALSLVGGLTWILLNLNAPTALTDVVVGCVLAFGGLVLLMPHRVSLPRTATKVAMPLAAIVGTGVGLFVTTEQRGDFAYVVEHGWPYRWVVRGAVAPDPDTAYRLAQSADWHVDLVALAGDLLVFAYAGMLIVVLALLIRSARRR